MASGVRVRRTRPLLLGACRAVSVGIAVALVGVHVLLTDLHAFLVARLARVVAHVHLGGLGRVWGSRRFLHRKRRTRGEGDDYETRIEQPLDHPAIPTLCDMNVRAM